MGCQRSAVFQRQKALEVQHANQYQRGYYNADNPIPISSKNQFQKQSYIQQINFPLSFDKKYPIKQQSQGKITNNANNSNRQNIINNSNTQAKYAYVENKFKSPPKKQEIVKNNQNTVLMKSKSPQKILNHLKTYQTSSSKQNKIQKPLQKLILKQQSDDYGQVSSEKSIKCKLISNYGNSCNHPQCKQKVIIQNLKNSQNNNNNNQKL